MFIQEKIESENGLKNQRIKTYPSQKSETLKWILKLKIIMQYFMLVLPQKSLLENYKKNSLNYIFSQKKKNFHKHKNFFYIKDFFFLDKVK